MTKYALGLLLADCAAVVTLGFLTFAFWPWFGDGLNTAAAASRNFMFFGSFVIAAVTLLIGVPLIAAFKAAGLLRRRNVIVGGVILAVAPAVILDGVGGGHSIFSLGSFVMFAVAGFNAAWVFCAVEKIRP